MYDEICVKIVCFENELLHFEYWNFGQFLRVDKTCFLRPGHIYTVLFLTVFGICLSKVSG